jgi:ABC-type branched-subunit amino acid transport system ATPase component
MDGRDVHKKKIDTLSSTIVYAYHCTPLQTALIARKKMTRTVQVYLVQHELAGLDPIILQYMNNNKQFEYTKCYEYQEEDKKLDRQILNDAFTMFNVCNQETFAKYGLVLHQEHHSLSVNDVVAIDGIYYRVDCIGFTRVPSINITK